MPTKLITHEEIDQATKEFIANGGKFEKLDDSGNFQDAWGTYAKRHSNNDWHLGSCGKQYIPKQPTYEF